MYYDYSFWCYMPVLTAALNSNFFLKPSDTYSCETDFRCDGSEETFWQYKVKCHLYVNINRSVSTTLHLNNNVHIPHITNKI